MAIVDVMGHVGRVVAELNGDVLAAGVLQLAVLPLAGTNNAQLLRLTHRRYHSVELLQTCCSPPSLSSTCFPALVL